MIVIKIFLIVLIVMFIFIFREKIVPFFRGFEAVKEVKEDGIIVVGPYVITPVKVVYANWYDNDYFSSIDIFTFEDGRTITKTIKTTDNRNLWDYIEKDCVCSRVQKFNSKGLLISEYYLPVSPENVLYRALSYKPYFKR